MAKKLSFFKEILGLYPYRLRFKQAMIAILGAEDVPASQAGLSALKHLYFYYGPKMWLGFPIKPSSIIISNLYNHTQTPYANGWSVKKTQTLDFRKRALTYDSHNGTDFAIVPGTAVYTAAAGQVVQIISEFNRGGLKIFIDHGQGLMTCYAHLARPLVKVGEKIPRGHVIALSGYSGLDALLTFPFGLPHIHFNVWLNGVPVDPFPCDADEVSLWRNSTLKENLIDLQQNLQSQSSQYNPSVYDEQRVQQVIMSCKTSTVRKSLLAIEDVSIRAATVIATRNYYPTRFEDQQSIYAYTHDRRSILDIPFTQNDFQDLVFLDEL